MDKLLEEIREQLRAAIREEFAKARIAMDKQFAESEQAYLEKMRASNIDDGAVTQGTAAPSLPVPLVSDFHDDAPAAEDDGGGDASTNHIRHESHDLGVLDDRHNCTTYCITTAGDRPKRPRTRRAGVPEGISTRAGGPVPPGRRDHGSEPPRRRAPLRVRGRRHRARRARPLRRRKQLLPRFSSHPAYRAQRCRPPGSARRPVRGLSSMQGRARRRQARQRLPRRQLHRRVRQRQVAPRGRHRRLHAPPPRGRHYLPAPRTTLPHPTAFAPADVLQAVVPVRHGRGRVPRRRRVARRSAQESGGCDRVYHASLGRAPRHRRSAAHQQRRRSSAALHLYHRCGMSTRCSIECPSSVLDGTSSVPVAAATRPLAITTGKHAFDPGRTTAAFLLFWGMFDDVQATPAYSRVALQKFVVAVQLDTTLPANCSALYLYHNIGASTKVLGTVLNIPNPKSMPYGAVIVWELSVTCFDWQPWTPPVLLEILLDSANIQPELCLNFTTSYLASETWCSSESLKQPWLSPSQKGSSFVAARGIESQGFVQGELFRDLVFRADAPFLFFTDSSEPHTVAEPNSEEILLACVIVWFMWTSLILAYPAGGAIEEAACRIYAEDIIGLNSNAMKGCHSFMLKQSCPLPLLLNCMHDNVVMQWMSWLSFIANTIAAIQSRKINEFGYDGYPGSAAVIFGADQIYIQNSGGVMDLIFLCFTWLHEHMISGKFLWLLSILIHVVQVTVQWDEMCMNGAGADTIILICSRGYGIWKEKQFENNEMLLEVGAVEAQLDAYVGSHYKVVQWNFYHGCKLNSGGVSATAGSAYLIGQERDMFHRQTNWDKTFRCYCYLTTSDISAKASTSTLFAYLIGHDIMHCYQAKFRKCTYYKMIWMLAVPAKIRMWLYRRKKRIICTLIAVPGPSKKINSNTARTGLFEEELSLRSQLSIGVVLLMFTWLLPWSKTQMFQFSFIGLRASQFLRGGECHRLSLGCLVGREKVSMWRRTIRRLAVHGKEVSKQNRQVIVFYLQLHLSSSPVSSISRVLLPLMEFML